MGKILLKTKIKLISEESMEISDLVDPNFIWVWRTTGWRSEEIYRIYAYNKTKTVLELYDGDKVLVAEPLQSVYEKWSSVKEDFEEVDNSSEENDDQ